jgi:hypothetical protein
LRRTMTEVSVKILRYVKAVLTGDDIPLAKWIEIKARSPRSGQTKRKKLRCRAISWGCSGRYPMWFDIGGLDG